MCSPLNRWGQTRSRVRSMNISVRIGSEEGYTHTHTHTRGREREGQRREEGDANGREEQISGKAASAAVDEESRVCVVAPQKK